MTDQDRKHKLIKSMSLKDRQFISLVNATLGELQADLIGKALRMYYTATALDSPEKRDSLKRNAPVNRNDYYKIRNVSPEARKRFAKVAQVFKLDNARMFDAMVRIAEAYVEQRPEIFRRTSKPKF